MRKYLVSLANERSTYLQDKKRLSRSITRSLICSRHGPRQEEVQANALKLGCTSCLRLDPASQANVLVSIAAASFHCNVDRSRMCLTYYYKLLIAAAKGSNFPHKCLTSHLANLAESITSHL